MVPWNDQGFSFSKLLQDHRNGYKRLEFGLDFKVHIVGCTTDGASEMAKFGKEITSFSYHQQCIAHCIHLAVCDILYCKVSKSSHDEGHNDVTVEDEIFEDK